MTFLSANMFATNAASARLRRRRLPEKGGVAAFARSRQPYCIFTFRSAVFQQQGRFACVDST
jgi:hypothetical protein